MKKHLLAFVLIGLVCLQAKETRACGELVVVGIIAAEIVGMSVSAAFWAQTENNRENVKGYACPQFGRPITWYCCSKNGWGQLSCNDMTVPCPENTFGMCYYGNYYGLETWRHTSTIYTDAAAQKIAGLTASTIIFAVGLAGTTIALGACMI